MNRQGWTIEDYARALDQAEARLRAMEDLCEDADRRHATILIVRRVRRALHN